MDELANYLPPGAFAKQYPNLGNEDSLRWMIRHRDQNGMDDFNVVVKRQGRVFLNVPRFSKWMQAGAKRKSAA